MDSPESVSQIGPFISMHKLDPGDWLLPGIFPLGFCGIFVLKNCEKNG